MVLVLLEDKVALELEVAVEELADRKRFGHILSPETNRLSAGLSQRTRGSLTLACAKQRREARRQPLIFSGAVASRRPPQIWGVRQAACFEEELTVSLITGIRL